MLRQSIIPGRLTFGTLGTCGAILAVKTILLNLASLLGLMWVLSCILILALTNVPWQHCRALANLLPLGTRVVRPNRLLTWLLVLKSAMLRLCRVVAIVVVRFVGLVFIIVTS